MVESEPTVQLHGGQTKPNMRGVQANTLGTLEVYQTVR